MAEVNAVAIPVIYTEDDEVTENERAGEDGMEEEKEGACIPRGV